MRFKKGDKVRYRDEKCSGTGVVFADNNSSGWFVKVEDRDHKHCPFNGGTTRIFATKNLELVEQPKFKVGDKVRIVAASIPHKEGHIGREFTISEQQSTIDGEPAWVGYPESRPYIWKSSELELVAAPLKIEAGKFYKTRDGRKVGPMEDRARYSGEYPFAGSLSRPYRDVSHNFIFRESGENYEYRDLDLIAEWTSSCAAAQVDNLREEYGPVVKAGNDNGKPKFKVGDVVKVVRHCNAWGNSIELDLPIGSTHSIVAKKDRVNGLDTYLLSGGGTNFYVHLNIEHATTPAIVALIENGQPKPSDRPHVHPSRGHAGDEAARLARKYPGKEFGVYELVDTRQIAKPAYAHEWQRLAADGLKIEAIKQLRDVTGLGLKATKEAVEHWLAVGEPYSRLAA